MSESGYSTGERKVKGEKVKVYTRKRNLKEKRGKNKEIEGKDVETRREEMWDRK